MAAAATAGTEATAAAAESAARGTAKGLMRVCQCFYGCGMGVCTTLGGWCVSCACGAARVRCAALRCGGGTEQARLGEAER